jgi:hypothetical protein
MKPVELRFHRPGRAALNEIAKSVITVRDDTHDSISLHALLQKEAIEETISPSRFGRYKHETRPKLPIALDPARRYLELPCDRVLSMLYIRVVDTNYQGLGSLGGLDVWSVRSVKSLSLKLPAYSHRVTANRHVACTYIAEAADPKDPGCRAIRAYQRQARQTNSALPVLSAAELFHRAGSPGGTRQDRRGNRRTYTGVPEIERHRKLFERIWCGCP